VDRDPGQVVHAAAAMRVPATMMGRVPIRGMSWEERLAARMMPAVTGR